MPYEAKNGTGDVVKASDITITEKDDIFYCCTPNCHAEMKIVNLGNVKEAYFRRLPSSPYHINAKCVRCGITFDKTKYDESRFSKKAAFDWLFSPPDSSHKGKTGTKTGKRGCTSIGFRSLGNIYRLCASLEKTDTYNGVLIDDIFADYENFSRYENNIEGNLILECSYYRKVYKELALLFNYPSDFKSAHNIVRLDFADEELFWKYYNKLKGCHHTEPIVIAGNWKNTTGNPDYQAQCTIVSSRQIYVVK